MMKNIRIGSLIACVAGLILAWVAHRQGQSWAQLEANGIEVAGTVVRATVKTELGEVPDYWLYVEYRPENDSSPLVSGFQVRKPFFQTIVSGDTIIAPAVRLKYEPGQPKKALILGGSIPEGGTGAVNIMLGIAGIGLIVFVVTGLLSKRAPKTPSGGQTKRIGFEVSHLPVKALDPMEAWILAKCQETGIECSFLNIGFMQDEGQGGVPGSGDLYFEGAAAQAEAIVPLLKEAIVVHVPPSELSKVEMHAVSQNGQA